MRRPTVLAAFLMAACSARTSASPIEVRDAWARPADSAGTTAAYLVIINRDSTPVALTAESSPTAESVTLHQTMAMAGMVHMMPLDTPQTILPGDSLALRAGARHLMVTGLRRKLSAGDTLSLSLTFGDGRVVRTTATVRAP
jgi:copper(I)-binding protein